MLWLLWTGEYAETLNQVNFLKQTFLICFFSSDCLSEYLQDPPNWMEMQLVSTGGRHFVMDRYLSNQVTFRITHLATCVLKTWFLVTRG